MNNLLEKSSIPEISNVVSTIAGGIVEYLNNIDNQIIEFANRIDGGIVGGIAKGIAGGIAEKYIRVLSHAKFSQSRRGILKELSLVNNANNFETYIQPLVAIDWLSMTLPEKPTSSKQQYIITFKGHLILKFLNVEEN